MESLTRFDLCNLAAEVISKELSTPDFTNKKTGKRDYEHARYLFVWFCFNDINASPKMINNILFPCWGYKKTVYQVIRRMYEKRKDETIKSDLESVRFEYRQQLNKYVVQGIKPLKDGKQLKIDLQ